MTCRIGLGTYRLAALERLADPNIMRAGSRAVALAKPAIQVVPARTGASPPEQRRPPRRDHVATWPAGARGVRARIPEHAVLLRGALRW